MAVARSGSAKTSMGRFLKICGMCDMKEFSGSWQFDGTQVGCNSEQVVVVLGFKDEVQSPSPPMRSVFDGIICGCSPGTLSSRCCGSNG